MSKDQKPGIAGVTRLIVGMAVCGLGVVAVAPHHTRLLWQASVMVGEWGHWLGILSLLLLPGCRRSWLHGAGATLTLAGVVLLLSPVARAMMAAPSITADMEATFGSPTQLSSTEETPRAAPLVLPDLLLGVSAGEVLLDEHAYSVDPSTGENLTLDLYRPAFGSNPRPVVLVLHGGGWTDGDKRQLTKLSQYLAARGYVVANLGYRLAPAWRFPAAQEDVANAIQYLKDLETTHGVDPSRIALLGRSAGGQIALLAGYTLMDPAIRGVVSLYAPAALRWGYENPAKPGIIDSSGVLELYLGGPPSTHGDTYISAEPSSFVNESSPPTLFVQGLRDEHVSPFHAEFVSGHLLEANIRHLVVRLPWATHGCDYVFSGPCGQATTYAVERFLGAVLFGVQQEVPEDPERQPGADRTTTTDATPGDTTLPSR